MLLEDEVEERLPCASLTVELFLEEQKCSDSDAHYVKCHELMSVMGETEENSCGENKESAYAAYHTRDDPLWQEWSGDDSLWTLDYLL